MGDSPHKLTARDGAILLDLAKYRFATAEDIRRQFFNKAKNSHTHYRRIRILQRWGYVEPLVGDFEHRLGYRLTKKGLTWAKAHGYEAIPNARTRPSYRTPIDHDRTLVRLREIFESSPVVSDFVPEWKVRSNLAKKHGIQKKRDDRYKVPDGIFKLRRPHGELRAALELEMAYKSKDRNGSAMRVSLFCDRESPRTHIRNGG